MLYNLEVEEEGEMVTGDRNPLLKGRRPPKEISRPLQCKVSTRTHLYVHGPIFGQSSVKFT